MAFDWQEYLEVARFLSGQHGGGFSEEAGLRTLISRAYYAAYGHALRHSRDHLGFAPAPWARPGYCGRVRPLADRARLLVRGLAPPTRRRLPSQ